MNNDRANRQINQILNMKNVTYIAKTNRLLGSYGSAEEGYMFEPKLGERESTSRDSFKSSGDVMYRGMLMIHNKERVIAFTSYSFIDLVSASGGIITGMMAVFGPIAGLFSKL